MALIHEGVGIVVRDATGTFERGESVVMLPNNPHEADPHIAENYLATSEFCGSGFDGSCRSTWFFPRVVWFVCRKSSTERWPRSPNWSALPCMRSAGSMPSLIRGGALSAYGETATSDSSSA